MPQYVDDFGTPIPSPSKTYLDDFGIPIMSGPRILGTGESLTRHILSRPTEDMSFESIIRRINGLELPEPEEFRFRNTRPLSDPLRPSGARPRTAGEKLTSTGIRVVPSIAGTIIGGAGGTVLSGGIPSPTTAAGASIGGALGSSIGEGLGQTYDKYLERKYREAETPYNPWQIGMQGAIGAVNLGGVSNIGKINPLLNPGKYLREAAKFVPRGGIEGALEGAISTYPTVWADTGDIASQEQVFEGMLGGLGFGSATGLAVGTLPALRGYQKQMRNPARWDYSEFSNPDGSLKYTPKLDGPGSKPGGPGGQFGPTPTLRERGEFPSNQQGLRFGTPEGGEQLPLPVHPPDSDLIRGPSASVSPNVDPIYGDRTLNRQLPLEPEPQINPNLPLLEIDPKDIQGIRSERKQEGEFPELKVEPPVEKPRFRHTAAGDIINPKTGEVLNVRAPGEETPQTKTEVPIQKEQPRQSDSPETQAKAEADYNAEVERLVNAEIEAAERGDTPSEAKVAGPVNPKTGRANIVMGGADKDVLDAIGVALYKSDPPSTSVTELLQNSADERNISGINKPIKIGFNHVVKNPETGLESNSIIVKDEGRGIQAKDLYTIFTDIGKSGKRAIAKARGGFGFAKAAPLLGGDYVKITSIVDENGQRVKYTFEGNPEQLKDEAVGVELNREVLPDQKTSTGFQVEVFFPQYKLHASEKKLKKIVENSPGMNDVEFYKNYDSTQGDIEKFLTGQTPSYGAVENLSGPAAFPKKGGTISLPGGELDIHFELDNIERKSGELIFLNNGAYALDDTIGYNLHEIPHVPGRIVINVKPTVKDTDRNYPFELNREGIKDSVKAAIKKWVKDNLVKDAEAVRIAELQKVFDDLTPAAGNKHVVLDSGKRYTPDELKRVEQSPHLRKVADVMDRMLTKLDALFPDYIALPGRVGNYPSGVDPALQSGGKTAKFGFRIADADRGGVNIPSPKASANSVRNAILVNPLGAMVNSATPMEAAEFLAHVTMHEFNHNIQRNEGAGFTWQLAWTDAKYGTGKRAQDAEAIFKAITGADGNYAPEIQDLLREYTAARGRPDTELDTLSRSAELAAPEQFRSSGVRGDVGSSGGRTSRLYQDAKDTLNRFIKGNKGAVGLNINPPTTPKPDNSATMWNIKPPAGAPPGGGKTPLNVNPPKRKPGSLGGDSTLEKAGRLAHGLKATGDLAPVLRQGKNYAGRGFWWKALGQQFKSYVSEDWHQQSREKLNTHDLMQAKKQYAGKNGEARSWSEMAGLYIGSHKQEEAMAGIDLAEKILRIPGVAGEKDLLNPARASARAFEVIDDIRLGAADKLYKNYKQIYESKKKIAKTSADKAEAELWNPDTQKRAEMIGEEVNQATGRSKLKTKERNLFGKKQIPAFDLEDKADYANLAFFSARYWKSNIDQTIKFADLPRKAFKLGMGHKDVDPVMVREHLKQLLSYAGLTTTLATLYATLGAKNELDPKSTSFGKSRFGRDVTADYMGGLGQYITLASRAGTRLKKTGSGKEVALDEGNPASGNVTDLFLDMIQNKVAPPVALAMAALNGGERYREKEGWNWSLNPFENTAMKTVANPITWQNVYEILKTDPEYSPLILADLLGGGVNVERKKK